MLNQLIRSALVVTMLAAPLALARDDGHATGSGHDFKAGSRVKLQALTPVQVENLTVAGKVWGFLKYHHPAVTGGQRQWDFELLKILPALLQAKDRNAADAVLHRWILALGPVADCNPCATLDRQAFQLLPRLKWLDDARLLSPALRNALKGIYRKRSSAGQQFYVSLAPGVGNPVFDKELEYKDLSFPDAGFQLLSLFRLWNIIEYWAPYRDLIDEDWDQVLADSVAPVALARDRATHELAMIAVVARIQDTHTNLWSSLHVRPPVGRCQLPLRVRFIEGRATVSAHLTGDAAAAQLKPGDTIESIDGVPVDRLLQSWRPYYAASNEPTRLRDMAGSLSKGDCGPMRLQARQGAEPKELSLTRVARKELLIPTTHDRAGDTFQLLGDDVAYIKLSSIKRADIPGYMERAAGTRGLIVDIRNYPSDFVPFALGQYFIDKPTSFVRFTVADLANPGGFQWGPELALQPQAARYTGKVMILVDEVSQSQSEYTAMALRAGPRAKVVGSTTAGADGNASWISLPGGLRTMISGIGVFYPDKRPTQRVGIVPDIDVRPTIEGIRAGRDEVLEAAIADIHRD